MRKMAISLGALIIIATGAFVSASLDRRPRCCCVGDGEGHYVCEPNLGECWCGCPAVNCQ